MDPMELQKAIAQALMQRPDDYPDIQQAPQRIPPAPRGVHSSMGAPRMVSREPMEEPEQGGTDPMADMLATEEGALNTGYDAVQAGAAGDKQAWADPAYSERLRKIQDAKRGLSVPQMPSNMLAKR